MVEFTKYMMPVQYSGLGVMKEHLQCRKSCSLFDVSHMGQVWVTGKDRHRFVEKVSTVDLTKGKNKAGLALMLNPEAGIIDDTIVTDMGDGILMVLNSGNKWGDLEHMERYRDGLEVEVEH